ncbi:hypothetical protein BVRB_9g211150 [Beta vulgaris subsp. vulgaris]|nr:hypothetical protein BVRB_9g211150 [Beta vulgaris subsp. vulgaris]
MLSPLQDKIDLDGLSCTEILGLADAASVIQQEQFQTSSPPQDKFDLDGLSCTEILGLADAASVIQQEQFQTPADATGINNQAAASEPALGTNEKVNAEVPPTPSKNKRQRVGLDVNKKPGEKRQNKYYWAKIDVQKVHTPKPKTPKPVTPKPIRKKALKKEVKREQVPNCKRALNFEEGRVVKVEKGETRNTEKQLTDDLSVYRRLRCKCLTQCQKLGPNFVKSFKKRSQRNKKSSFKQFEGFNHTSILQDLLDRIAVVKGKSRMLLFSRVKTFEEVKESSKCIMSILASPMKFNKKKRSSKRLTSTVRKQAIIPDHTMPCSLPLLESLIPSEENKQDKVDVELCQIGSEELHERVVSSSRCSTSNRLSNTENKVKVAKEKMSKRTYKRKDKRENYLSKLDDWNNTSLEQIMDAFVQEFEALQLYDDPKKLERWSVMLSEPNIGDDGSEIPNEESARFREEREILLAKIYKFISEMTKYQGSKEFVKWNGSVLDSMVGVFLTQNVSDVLSSNAYMALASRYPIKEGNNEDGGDAKLNNGSNKAESVGSNVIIEYPYEEETIPVLYEEETISIPVEVNSSPLSGGEEIEEGGDSTKEYEAAFNDMMQLLPFLQKYKLEDKKVGDKPNKVKVDWEGIRLHFVGKNNNPQRNPDTHDSVDWDAVRKAPLAHIATTIKERGQNWIIARKIQRMLNRLIHQHGTLDVQWLRNAPPQVAKAYLLSFYGLGLKSVECLRLLTLHHHGFPVDVNIARTAIRLGWVPLKPLPLGLPFHLLQKYPLENEIQQYLWPRLCHLKQESLYQIHYQMITFGKVFCLKKNPNCRACPLKQNCKYYKSVVDSTKMKHPLLSWTNNKMVKSKRNSKKIKNLPNPFNIKKSSIPLLVTSNHDLSITANLSPIIDCNTNLPLLESHHSTSSQKCNPIVEFPASPKKAEEPDIEDLFKDDDVNEVDEEDCIVIKLETHLFEQALSSSIEEHNVSSHNDGLSRALVSISPYDTSIPLPKQINPARLRTEHQVYELPYNHLLLKDFDRQQGHIPYLLAIWTQGQNEKIGDNLEGCYEHSVPGTILIPVRSAMRGSFPLNGTYFQVNEV